MVPQLPGPDPYLGRFWVMFKISNLLILILKSFQLFGVCKIDSMALLLCWPFMVAIFAFAIEKWIKYYHAKVLNTFDVLLHDESASMDEIFPTPSKFLVSVEIAFYRGHLYVVSWRPFLWAIEKWPDEVSIWILFIRFLVIYPEAKTLLQSVYERFADTQTSYILKHSFLFCARRYVNSRDRSESKELRREFRICENRINKIKKLMVSFWGSVLNNTISLTFSLAVSLNQKVANIESHLFHLSVLYPINPYVCRRYAHFLQSVESDPRMAASWRERAFTLESTGEVTTDPIARRAFHLFPWIPRNLASVHHILETTGSEPPSGETRIPGPGDTEASAVSHQSAEMSGNDSSGELLTGSEIEVLAPSHIREIAMSITIPPIRHW
jgi:hypothetical protein